MKSYEEMSESVLERIDVYNKEKEAKKKTAKRVLISLTAVFVLTLVAIGICKSGIIGNYIEKSGGDHDKTGITLVNEDSDGETVIVNPTDNENTNDPLQTTEVSTSQANQGDSSYGGEQSGGNVGGWNIRALPFDKQIKVIGEELTDEEAAEYFKENTVRFKNELTASGVSADNLVIMPKGYCHVMYDGVEGKSLEIRQNFRDYLAYNGDKLVAIITLTKEDGKLFASPSFGGPWFDDFNAMLQRYKGQELIFIYAGWMEFVVTPDNSYFSPMGTELGLDFGDIDKFKTFYHPKAVYVP
ncbi:MAG: hypothetical protein E7515_01450 [Ruminococcaceae bacterium]|nr:hypothetical protein [Oscillospiraceae bacterium]